MRDDIREVPPSPVEEKPRTEEKEEKTEAFITPEEIAVHDNYGPDEVIDLTSENDAPEPKKAKVKFWKKYWPPTKKQSIIAGSALTLVIILALGGWYLASHHKPTTANVIHKAKTAIVDKISATVPSTLTGLPVAPSANQRPITAVMIENLPAARPQSGLSQAGVVFEALTEGGITRFMALYQDQQPTNVGPVRSVRPYFVDWALGFDAPIAHDGGSPQALSEITSLNAKDLDQMYNSAPYTRISSRPSPHNLYASIPALVSLEASKGWTSSNFTAWPRKPDAPAKNPNATNINFDLSYSTYNVSYSYNSKTNSYDRSEGAAPQIDANTNKQLSPKVVIGMIVPWSQGSLDTSNAYYSVYQDVGSGQAYIFQDGTVTIGEWNKASEQGPLSFTTTSGQPIKLDAGQTWITALASTSNLTYN